MPFRKLLARPASHRRSSSPPPPPLPPGRRPSSVASSTAPRGARRPRARASATRATGSSRPVTARAVFFDTPAQWVASSVDTGQPVKRNVPHLPRRGRARRRGEGGRGGAGDARGRRGAAGPPSLPSARRVRIGLGASDASSRPPSAGRQILGVVRHRVRFALAMPPSLPFLTPSASPRWFPQRASVPLSGRRQWVAGSSVALTGRDGAVGRARVTPRVVVRTRALTQPSRGTGQSLFESNWFRSTLASRDHSARGASPGPVR